MNLKPNEDGEYAEVQKQISMFKTNIFLFCQGRCLGAFYADISNGGSHQWAILYSSCTGLYHIGNVIAAIFVIGHCFAGPTTEKRGPGHSQSKT